MDATIMYTVRRACNVKTIYVQIVYREYPLDCLVWRLTRISIVTIPVNFIDMVALRFSEWCWWNRYYALDTFGKRHVHIGICVSNQARKFESSINIVWGGTSWELFSSSANTLLGWVEQSVTVEALGKCSTFNKHSHNYSISLKPFTYSTK